MKSQLKEISKKNEEDEQKIISNLDQIDKLTSLKSEFENRSKIYEDKISTLQVEVSNLNVEKDQLNMAH